MEINEYNEFIPEKELQTNFKIPKKRSAVQSFGIPENEEQYTRRSRLTQSTQSNNISLYAATTQGNCSGPPAGIFSDSSPSMSNLTPNNYNPNINDFQGYNNCNASENNSSYNFDMINQRNTNNFIPDFSNNQFQQQNWIDINNHNDQWNNSNIPQQGYNFDEQNLNRGFFKRNTDRFYKNRKFENNNAFEGKNIEPESVKNNYFAHRINKDLLDESLPKELRDMFQPLYCKLCSAQMSSNQMAKLHYNSKNHEKKIRKYLTEYSEKTGNPLHPRATITAATFSKTKNEEDEPKYFHCDICDLPLTGKLHAESHYMGQKHNAVVMGKKQPSGKGYYDESGKWIRETTQQKFTNQEQDETSCKKTSIKVFTCSICNISCTCQEQLDNHFNGTRHKKKLKSTGVTLENFEITKVTEVEKNSKTENDKVFENPENNVTEEKDFSRYITPSGQYYCQTCNLSLNSLIQLSQHLISKNHFKNLNKKNNSPK